MRSRLTIGSLVLATGLLIFPLSPADAEPTCDGSPDAEPLDAEVKPKEDLAPPASRGGGSRAGDQAGHEREEPRRADTKAVSRIGAEVASAEGGGAVVRSVAAEYPASMLQPGDVILAVNDEPVKNVQDLVRDIARAPDDTPLLLRVRRGGEVRLVGIRLAEPPASPEPAIGGGPSPWDAGSGDDAGAGKAVEESGDAAP